MDTNLASEPGRIVAMADSLESSEKAARKVFRRYFPLILILWILFVLYPNPVNLVVSIQRVLNFDADPGAVEFMLNDFPFDPVEIEKAVLARIPYHRDWELYGMPWYCPTVKQVLEREGGDCKARALVLASVLEAKNIPYEVRSSPMHIWVDYEQKQETSFENPQVEFYQYNPETRERRFQVPSVSGSELVNSLLQQFWTPMPEDRKALLIGGSFALIGARVILRKRKAAQVAGG